MGADTKIARKATPHKREILEKLYQGMEPLEIQDIIGVDGKTFDAAMRMILESLAKEFGDRPIEHVYAEYMIQGTTLMRKLEKVANESQSARDSVSALKASWDIRKDLLKTALDFGVIESGKANEVGGSGISISFAKNMTNEEIRISLHDTLIEFKTLDEKFGKDAGILDVTSEKLFSGDSVFDIKETRTED